MFGTKETDINILVDVETKKAEDKFGMYYASKHEAYAVLKEEIEEALEDIKDFKWLMHIFWLSVRGRHITKPENYSDLRHIGIIKEKAKHLAQESIQIAAVCNKIENSIKENKV